MHASIVAAVTASARIILRFGDKGRRRRSLITRCCILLRTADGAAITISSQGITLDNGKGAVITVTAASTQDLDCVRLMAAVTALLREADTTILLAPVCHAALSLLVAAGSLSAAARRLGMTPSAVSQHLRQLEQALGVHKGAAGAAGPGCWLWG